MHTLFLTLGPAHPLISDDCSKLFARARCKSRPSMVLLRHGGLTWAQISSGR